MKRVRVARASDSIVWRASARLRGCRSLRRRRGGESLSARQDVRHRFGGSRLDGLEHCVWVLLGVHRDTQCAVVLAQLRLRRLVLVQAGAHARVLVGGPAHEARGHFGWRRIVHEVVGGAGVGVERAVREPLVQNARRHVQEEDARRTRLERPGHLELLGLRERSREAVQHPSASAAVGAREPLGEQLHDERVGHRHVLLNVRSHADAQFALDRHRLPDKRAAVHVDHFVLLGEQLGDSALATAGRPDEQHARVVRRVRALARQHAPHRLLEQRGQRLVRVQPVHALLRVRLQHAVRQSPVHRVRLEQLLRVHRLPGALPRSHHAARHVLRRRVVHLVVDRCTPHRAPINAPRLSAKPATFNTKME